MTTEILGGSLALALATGAYYKIDNVNLEKDIIVANNTIKELKVDKENLNNSIEEQNNAITSIQVDIEAKMNEYLKNTPKIAEKVLNKYVKDVNITRGNCNDANDLNRYLDNITL